MTTTDKINWAAVDIERRDYETGELLQVFATRKEAAQWLIAHHGVSDPTGLLAYQYANGLHIIATRQGWSRGFSWRYGDPATSVGKPTHIRAVKRAKATGPWKIHSVEQLHPTTGTVLRTFGSQADATRWLIENMGDYSTTMGMTPATVAGGLCNCIKYERFAYGYVWRSHDPQAALARALELKSKPVQVFGVQNKYIKSMVFASVAEAAARLELDASDIRKHIGDSKPPINGFIFRWYNVNAEPKVFGSTKEAALFFGIPAITVKRKMELGQLLNNTVLTVDKTLRKRVYTTGPYRVLDGDAVHVFKTLAGAAAHIGVTRQAVCGMVDTGRLVRGLYLVERVNTVT